MSNSDLTIEGALQIFGIARSLQSTGVVEGDTAKKRRVGQMVEDFLSPY